MNCSALVYVALACGTLFCASPSMGQQAQKNVLIQFDKKTTPAQQKALQEGFSIKPADVNDKFGAQIWQLPSDVDSEGLAKKLKKNPLVISATPLSTSRVDIFQTNAFSALPNDFTSRINAIRPPGKIESVNAILPFEVTNDILVKKSLPVDLKGFPVKFDLSPSYKIEAGYGRAESISIGDGKTALMWSAQVQVSTLIKETGLLKRIPGRATFVFSDRQTWGRIDSAQGTRLFSPGPVGYMVSVALAASTLPPDHAPAAVNDESSDTPLSLSASGVQDCKTPSVNLPGTELTLGIVFTPGALDSVRRAYTTDVIEKPCPMLLTILGDINDSFQISMVPIRFRLVAVAQATNYVEPKRTDGRRSVSAVLKQALNKADRVGKAIDTWRGKNSADIVLVLVAADDACGAADENIDKWNDEARAIAVADARCAIAIRTAAHEIGHVMGLRHDRNADATGSPFPYGHGFVHDKPPMFMTIMGTRVTCPACARTNYWSNPAVVSSTYGVIMGDAATAHEARVLKEVAPTIAKFR